MTGPTLTSPHGHAGGGAPNNSSSTTPSASSTAAGLHSTPSILSAAASVSSSSSLPANTKSDYLHYLTSYETMVRQQDSEYDATKSHILKNVYRRVQLLGRANSKTSTKSKLFTTFDAEIEDKEESGSGGGMLTYIQMRRCLLRLGIGWKRSYFPTPNTTKKNDNGDEFDYDDDDISVLSYNSTSSRHSGISGGLFSATGSSTGGGGGGDIIVSDSQLIMLLVTLVEMEERHRALTMRNNCSVTKKKDSVHTQQQHQQQKGLYLPDFILAYKLIIGGMQSIKSVNTTPSPRDEEKGDSTNHSITMTQAQTIALCTRLKERTLGMLQPFGPNSKIYNYEDDALHHHQQQPQSHRNDQYKRSSSKDALLSSSSFYEKGISLRDNIKEGLIAELQQNQTHVSKKSKLPHKEMMKKVMRSKDVTLAKIMEEHELEIENVSSQLETLRLEELQMLTTFQRKRMRSIFLAILAGCVLLSMGIILEKRHRRYLERELLLSQREKERRLADARTIELFKEKKLELEKKLYVMEGKMRYQVDRTKDMENKVMEVTKQLDDVDMKWLIDKVEIERCRSSQVEFGELLRMEHTKNEDGNEELVWCRSRLQSQEREMNELEHVSSGSSSTWRGGSGDVNTIRKSTSLGIEISDTGGDSIESTLKTTRGSRHQHRPVYLEMKYNKSMRNAMLLRQTYSAVAGMAVSATFHSLMGALMPKAAVKILAPVFTPTPAEVILGRAERVVDGIFGSSVAFLLIRAVVLFVSAL
ncbi:hypothetical protein ACHAWU_002266 [Discostella pseudostelligera]|uniref:Uncharacterized protein n=1 Tax=Discostella pseudostelligera TaxID=259834 RepID=A0ABD3MN62_9STRA